MELLNAVRHYQTWIVRFRIDAALYDFAPIYEKGKRPAGRPALKGKRQASLTERLNDQKTKWTTVIFSEWYGQTNKKVLITSGKSVWYRGGKPAVPLLWILIKDPEGKLEPMVIACTDLDAQPIEVIRHYLKRWCVEVTFEEVRAHLGVETQRQWSDLAILRSTPILMALFSLVTLWAEALHKKGKLYIFPTAWYQKKLPTFSDALHSVRIRIWKYQFNLRSLFLINRKEIKQLFFNHLAFMAARAA